MSRLDYITVGIVALCILAIIFLVYKMTDLFSGNQAKEKTEIAKDTVEQEDDDIYDYELDEEIDTTDSGQPATDDAKPTSPVTPAAPATTTSEPPRQPAATAASSGRYMVVSGTFTRKALADQYAASLKKKGYNNATVEIFDRGKFAVVLVDRFDSLTEAEQLKAKLKGEGVEAYVKLKRQAGR